MVRCILSLEYQILSSVLLQLLVGKAVVLRNLVAHARFAREIGVFYFLPDFVYVSPLALVKLSNFEHFLHYNFYSQ